MLRLFDVRHPARVPAAWLAPHLDPHAAVLLPLSEILGQDHVTPDRASRLKDRGVPVGELEAIPRRERGDHGGGEVRDREAQKRRHECRRLCVRERVGTARTGGLHVGLLQYLDRQGDVARSEHVVRASRLVVLAASRETACSSTFVSTKRTAMELVAVEAVARAEARDLFLHAALPSLEPA